MPQNFLILNSQNDKNKQKCNGNIPSKEGSNEIKTATSRENLYSYTIYSPYSVNGGLLDNFLCLQSEKINYPRQI